MKTIREEFEFYIKSCYPKGVTESQYKHLQSAWYAATTATLTSIIEEAHHQKPEKVGERIMELLKECQAYSINRIAHSALNQLFDGMFEAIVKDDARKN